MYNKKQDIFTQLTLLRQMGIIDWQIFPAKGLETQALFEILREQGYCRIANILKKELQREIEDENTLHEMAR